jgi:hypothetical protein
MLTSRKRFPQLSTTKVLSNSIKTIIIEMLEETMLISSKAETNLRLKRSLIKNTKATTTRIAKSIIIRVSNNIINDLI